MGRNVTEKHEHGEFICEWVDEVPPLGEDRKTIVAPLTSLENLKRQLDEVVGQARGNRSPALSIFGTAGDDQDGRTRTSDLRVEARPAQLDPLHARVWGVGHRRRIVRPLARAHAWILRGASWRPAGRGPRAVCVTTAGRAVHADRARGTHGRPRENRT